MGQRTVIRHLRVDEDVTHLYRAMVKEKGHVPQPMSFDDCEVFVAEHQGRIVGFGALRAIEHYGRRYTQGVCLYVQSQYRETEVSRRLYRRLMSRVKQLAKPLFVMCEPEDEYLWLKCGYQVKQVILTREL